MALITISTDQYYDGTSRSAGDTYTINGATFTIRTDTRWCSGAPASMTGTIASVSTSASVGGTIAIDATKVRWLPFNSGSGTVPAIGASITQGGVTGILLGVWDTALQSAPISVGSAMPLSGYIKFLSVTGGTFASGALAGIGASATGPDVVGWIEVVFDVGSSVSLNSLSSLTTVGDWFVLGQTYTPASSGLGMTFQVPTNGGGTNTSVSAFQVETGPGTGVYEWWFTTTAAIAWSQANFTTDARAKFAQNLGNGQIQIGSDGSVNVGYMPPAGCNVRIPNIFIRSAATTTRATNALPGTFASSRGGINIGTGAKTLSIQNAHCEWGFSPSPLAVQTLLFKNSAVDYTTTFTSCKSSIIDTCAFGGGVVSNNSNAALQITNTSSGTISNSRFAMLPSGLTQALVINACSGLTLSNVECTFYKVRTSTGYAALGVNASSNITATTVKVRGGAVQVTSCSNIKITTVDYIDSLAGDTTTANGLNAVIVKTSAAVTVDGFTFGNFGALTNTHCYSDVFSTATNTGVIKFRNAGTRTSMIQCNTNPPNSIWTSAGSESNIQLQRLYFSSHRTGNVYNVTQPYTMSNILIEEVFGNLALATSLTFQDSILRAVGSSVGSTSTNAAFGAHWIDYFTSDTAGAVLWVANSPSTASAAYNYLTVTPNQGTGYLATGTLSLDTAGDMFYSEMPYFVKGHDTFQNVAPVITSTSATAMTYQYQIDTGSGWGGVWKNLTGANLSIETVGPSGFKLKIRGTQGAAPNSANVITSIKLLTTTVAADQANFLYPLDTNTLSFTGLQPGSEVYVYTGTSPSGTLLGSTTNSGTTFSLTHTAAGQTGYIHVLNSGYQDLFFTYTFKSADDSILIQQTVDRWVTT